MWVAPDPEGPTTGKFEGIGERSIFAGFDDIANTIARSLRQFANAINRIDRGVGYRSLASAQALVGDRIADPDLGANFATEEVEQHALPIATGHPIVDGKRAAQRSRGGRSERSVRCAAQASARHRSLRVRADHRAHDRAGVPVHHHHAAPAPRQGRMRSGFQRSTTWHEQIAGEQRRNMRNVIPIARAGDGQVRFEAGAPQALAAVFDDDAVCTTLSKASCDALSFHCDVIGGWQHSREDVAICSSNAARSVRKRTFPFVH